MNPIGLVWREFNAIRIEAAINPRDPGVTARHVRELDLTDSRRRHLDARLKEHGRERVLDAWRWVCTSPHRDAVYLRTNGHDNPETFLRPDNCAKYVEKAEREQSVDTMPAANTTPSPAGGLAAWQAMESLQNAGHHGSNPPSGFDRDAHRDRLWRMTLSDIGGWRTFCLRDQYTAKTMREAFVAAWDRRHRSAA
jgi:hypothetical protein